MTLYDLKNYRVLVKGIEVKEKKLERMRKNPPSCAASKVEGSSRNFPYTKRTFFVGYGESVSNMSPAKWQEKVRKLEGQIACDLDSARKLQLEIDTFIAEINTRDKERDKLIFEYYTHCGMTMEEIAKQVNLTKGAVSLIMNKLLEEYNGREEE